MDEPEEKLAKVTCRKCRHETNHALRAGHQTNGSDLIDERHTIDWFESHEVLQCLGCDAITFRSRSGDSEDREPDGSYVQQIAVYPEWTERPELEDVELVPTKLGVIYKETLTALCAKQPVLAGIGIRAILETVCKEKKAAGSSLFDQINGLVKQGVLTQEGADILHKLRVLGNNAAHEVKAHTSDQLNLAMRVIEHLLEAVYILPHRSKRLFGPIAKKAKKRAATP